MIFHMEMMRIIMKAIGGTADLFQLISIREYIEYIVRNSSIAMLHPLTMYVISFRVGLSGSGFGHTENIFS